MTTTNDDRFRILLNRIRALSMEHRSDALVYLSGYAPDACQRALDQIEEWNAPRPASQPFDADAERRATEIADQQGCWCDPDNHECGAVPCPVCNDTFTVAISGPDENGQYDTDDCPCQTVDQMDPEERWYALHDGWVS